MELSTTEMLTWIVIGLIAGFIANKKGRSFIIYLMGFLFFLGIFVFVK